MPVTTPPKMHAIFDVTADTNDGFRIAWAGPSTADITLARGAGETSGYYIRAYTAEAIPAGRTGGAPGAATGVGAQLIEEIQARVRAVGAPWGAFSCVVSDTGIVTMSDPATTFTIDNRPGTTSWTGTAGLAQILGYTGALTPTALSFVAPNQHRYGWYPNVPPVAVRGMVGMPDLPSSDSKVQRAPSGLVTTRSYSAALRDQTFVFGFLDDGKALIQSSGEVNESLQQFWDDALRTGARLRYYQDRTVQTAPGGGAPWGYVNGPKIAREGPQSFTPEVDTQDFLWRSEIDLYRFVASP